jgi:hypothetical protein
MIHWVSFNLHEENHHRLLLLFTLFHGLEIDLEKDHNLWRDAYLIDINNIEN